MWYPICDCLFLGVVTDENGDGVEGAQVVVMGVEHNVTTTSRGEYWRLLLPGNYNLVVTAWGYETIAPVPITVVQGNTTIMNFSLRSTHAGTYHWTKTDFHCPYWCWGSVILSSGSVLVNRCTVFIVHSSCLSPLLCTWKIFPSFTLYLNLLPVNILHG